ncbi:MAG: hypothetical protein AAGG57_08130 [Pseudomonadota bacterium]
MNCPTSSVFCTLSQPELRKRKAEVRESLTPHFTASLHSRGVSQVTFAKPAVSQAKLRHLIELEQACCPFFSFEIRELDREFMLIISGLEGSESFVRDLFSSDQDAGCGCLG